MGWFTASGKVNKTSQHCARTNAFAIVLAPCLLVCVHEPPSWLVERVEGERGKRNDNPTAAAVKIMGKHTPSQCYVHSIGACPSSQQEGNPIVRPY